MKAIAAALAIALSACTLTVAPAPAPSLVTTAASSATRSGTPPPSTTPQLAADPRFGWIAPTSPGLKVRRETAAGAIVQVAGDGPFVSPDGRNLAYWAPAGVRRVLHVVSLPTNADRVVVTLTDEVGEAVGWATDGSGLAFQADSRIIPGGGVDPPPAYSAIRTIDLDSGRVAEVLRRATTRLVPFGWSRARGLIAANVSSGAEGGPTAYLVIREDGTARDTSLGSDFCVHSIGLRLDTSGSTVLSIHPERCSHSVGGTFAMDGPSTVRAWPIDDPTRVTTIDLGPVGLLDAVFRPRTTDIVTTSISGDALSVDIWSSGARRSVLKATARNAAGTEFVPVIFRPNQDVALIHYPGVAPNSLLVDVASGSSTSVDLQGDSPIASVLLGD